MRRKKGFECKVFTPIIRIESLNFGLKTILNKGFEGNKDFFDLRFGFEWIHPAIARIVIDQYQIVFVVLSREYWRLPYVRENVLQRFRRDNGALVKGKFMNFIQQTIIARNNISV